MNKQSLASKTGRLKQKYNEEIKNVLKDEFAISNIMAVPELKKITINLGIGALSKNKEGKESLQRDMALIAGQKLSERKAKISVATFSIREGMVVGLSATIRGERMYAFFDKFVNIVLPRLRDFRGVKAISFDKFGNYTIGMTDHTVFPEIDVTKCAPAHGLEITFTVKNATEEKGRRLMELLGMPFEKEN